jgi:hypothetical protein
MVTVTKYGVKAVRKKLWKFDLVMFKMLVNGVGG